jgi:hypothetical protein
MWWDGDGRRLEGLRGNYGGGDGSKRLALAAMKHKRKREKLFSNVFLYFFYLIKY